ncbi:MAG: hypothetical protein VXW38_05215 [Bacteroidota bacterium]|nr:hypothetical protein [Bacteroidota bacterium]
MKKYMFPLLALPLFLWSCNNKLDTRNKDAGPSVSANKNTEALPTKSTVGSMNDLKAMGDKLRKATPTSKETFKEWLPDELLGMQRTGYTLGAMVMGEIASVEVHYASADKVRKLKVELMDCAGEMGASVAMAAQTTLIMDYEEESETKSKRILAKNGVRAVEEYQKNKGNTILEALIENRFYVKVTGEKMEPEEVWEALVALKAQSLIE